jgi:hypothetical protein
LAQVEALGPEGLEAAGRKIESALKSQHLPPDHVLRSIPVADVDSITFRSFAYYNQTSEAQPPEFDLRSVPFPFYLDDMKSRFVRLNFLLDTSSLPAQGLI